MKINFKSSFIVLTTFLLLNSMFPLSRNHASEAAAASPAISFAYGLSEQTFGKIYDSAIHNLTVLNTVGHPAFFQAGTDYPNDAWTRDGSLNTWAAGSLVDPLTSLNTLNKLIKDDPVYGKIIDEGNKQWWDMVIWSTSAWNYFKITGDTDFLSVAYSVTVNTLNKMRKEHYNSTYGLFKGPSFFNDGIAGYPAPLNDDKGSSFVLDHPGTAATSP